MTVFHCVVADINYTDLILNSLNLTFFGIFFPVRTANECGWFDQDKSSLVDNLICLCVVVNVKVNRGRERRPGRIQDQIEIVIRILQRSTDIVPEYISTLGHC